MVAAEPVQRAQAGDQVGDLGRGPRHPRLLFAGAGADPPGQHAEDREDRSGSRDHQRAQPDAADAERDRRDEHRDQRADQHRHDLDDVGGLVGVLGGDGQHLAGPEADVSRHRFQAGGGHLDPPPVCLGRICLLQHAHPEPPGQRHGRDQHCQRPDRPGKRAEPEVPQRVLDDQAERDGERRFGRLVHAHQHGAPRHRGHVAPQRDAQDVGSRTGVRSCHRRGGQSLRGCAG